MNNELREIDTNGKNFLEGFVPLKKITDDFKRLSESGMTPEQILKEAHVTADFAGMADILNISLFKAYSMPEDRPMFDLTKLVERKYTTDFKDVKVYQLREVENFPEVLEKQNYLGKPLRDLLKKQYGLKKWGEILSLSWEAWINDNLGEVKQIPSKLMRAAKRRRILNISALYENNLAFFNAANGNITGGGVNVAALEVAIELMLSQVDLDTNPIYIYPKYLVVGTNNVHAGKRMVADFQSIVSAITKGTMPLNYDLELLVDPRIPTNTNRWYLFADPNELPALQMLFLNGHEQPELFLRETDQQRISEFNALGGKDPFGGTFTNDDIEFKGRDIHNETTIDHRAAVMSTGI